MKTIVGFFLGIFGSMFWLNCQQIDVKLADGSIMISPSQLKQLACKSNFFNNYLQKFPDHADIDLTKTPLKMAAFFEILEQVCGLHSRNDICQSLNFLDFSSDICNYFRIKSRLMRNIKIAYIRELFWNKKPSNALLAINEGGAPKKIDVLLRSEQFNICHPFACNERIDEVQVSKLGNRMLIFSKEPIARFTLYDIASQDMNEWSKIGNFTTDGINPAKQRFVFSLDPAGEHLFIAIAEKGKMLIDAIDGKIIKIISTDSLECACLTHFSWHPKGTLISYADAANRTRPLYDLVKDTEILKNSVDDDIQFKWDDDSLVCIKSKRDTSKEYVTYNITVYDDTVTQEKSKKIPFASDSLNITISPCGKFLLYATGGQQIIKSINNDTWIHRESQQTGCENFSWSKDSSVIAGRGQGEIFLFDTSDLVYYQQHTNLKNS